MHEYSVVAALLESCLSHIESNNAKSATKITISIGERANIDKTLLESAFNILKDEYTQFSHTTIDIKIKELLLQCRACGGVFHSLTNPVCPFCHSKDTFIAQGRDIMLESLELEM